MARSPALLARRDTLRLSVLEGVLYAGMVGLGEFWFVADAVRQDGSVLALAALVTVPQLVGAVGSTGMLRALRRAPSRRPLTALAVGAQAFALAVLAVLSALHLTSPWLLVGFLSLHQGAAGAAGVSWSSWFGEVVPERLRGRYFGRRGQWVAITTFAGMLAGGLALHLLEPAAADAGPGIGGLGYALCYGGAAVLRLSCVGLLLRSWEPAFVPPEAADDLASTLTGPEAGGARGVLFAGAAMLFAVCIATPFFAPHMLETLRFSYPVFLAANGTAVLGKVLALGPWGRLVDRHGPVRAWLLSAMLVAVVPLPWVFADRAWIVFAGQALSGVAWAGHEVSLLGLTLAARSDRRRAVLFTAQSLAHGFAQPLGGLCGSAMAEITGGVHAPMFAASAAGRMLVVLLAPIGLRSLGDRGHARP